MLLLKPMIWRLGILRPPVPWIYSPVYNALTVLECLVNTLVYLLNPPKNNLALTPFLPHLDGIEYDYPTVHSHSMSRCTLSVVHTAR